MKILIANTKATYVGKLTLLQEACKGSKLELETLTQTELLANPSGLHQYLIEHNFDAVLHRNEHGRLFADGSLEWVRYLIAQRFPVLSVDFGYLSHYKTFMFDFYDAQLRSSIHEEWSSIKPVDWDAAPAYIQEYRSSTFKSVARADNSKYAGSVGIWMQWNAKLLRPELGSMTQAEWINDVATRLEKLGKSVIVKHNAVTHSELYEHTVPKIRKSIRIICDKEKLLEHSPRLEYDRFANFNMVAGCDYHVILSSSVSNLMVLCNKPVIAMGGSWFNALDVFSESVDPQAPLTRPTINRAARDKWLAWWLNRHVPMAESASALEKVLLKAKAYFSRPEGELWKYDYIYTHPEEFPHYGSSNHGLKAIPLLTELDPTSLIDVGCGGNEFKTLLAKTLPNCTVIGVDPASPKADIKATAQKLPFDNKAAMVITAFDVLEHIEEKDVPKTFIEFQRVSKFFVFRIAQRDSRLRVHGLTLHPTVHPTAWWLNQLNSLIAWVKVVDGYILGEWK